MATRISVVNMLENREQNLNKQKKSSEDLDMENQKEIKYEGFKLDLKEIKSRITSMNNETKQNYGGEADMEG